MFSPDFQWRDKGVKAILRLMGPSVVAASTTQVNVLVNSIFASKLGDGPTFWLPIAFRLMQLPLGIFGVALGTVALPLLARMAATGNMTSFRSELSQRNATGIPDDHPVDDRSDHAGRAHHVGALPTSINSTAYEAAEAAGALRFYAIGLSGYAALKVLVNAFYALDRRKTPMFVSFTAVALNLVLNWFFTLHLGWGHRGLALVDRLHRNVELPAPVLPDAPATEAARNADDAGAARQADYRGGALAAVCWLGSHYLLADWATQAFWPKASFTCSRRSGSPAWYSWSSPRL